MNYVDELKAYTNNITMLVGITPNAADYSSGNPLLETGTAYVLMRSLGPVSDQDKSNFKVALGSCRPSLNVFFSKNPGTKDEVSHDDVIGVVAGYSAASDLPTTMAWVNVVMYGESHGWVLSTSGKFYWDAWAKPWHRAFYKLASGDKVSILGKLWLAAYILEDAAFNKDSTSDKRLIWLILKTVKGRSSIVDAAGALWWGRLKKTFGTMKNVFKIYFGPDHIFTKYVNE